MKEKKLKGKVVSGLFWTFSERVVAQGVSFVVSIILARLMLPSDYGIVALILVFINLADVFVSDGLGEALIQKKDADDKAFSTIFFVSLVFSIFLYTILYISAPVIGRFYENEQLCVILRILSLRLPIAAVNTIQRAYVSKKMKFKKFFFSTIGGTLVSGVVGIIMAIQGFGVWALLVQYLLNSTIDTIILFFTVSWRPKLIFDRVVANELIGYGWKLMVAQFINRLYSEMRNLVIGKIYTTADLAYYNKGNQMPALAIRNLNTSISTVLFPAMSCTNDNRSRLKEITRKSMKLSSYAIFPLMIGLFVTAEPLIILLLTDKWAASIVYMRMCCIFWMFQPIQTANVQTIKASGRSDICLKLEIVKKIIGISLLIITMNISVYALVLANTVFAGISMVINIIPIKKLINYGYGEQLLDILPSLLLSIFMGASMWLVTLLSMSMIYTLVIEIVVGITVYIVGSYLFKIDSYFYIRGFFIKFLNSRKQK